jgi:hypothetical protein
MYYICIIYVLYMPVFDVSITSNDSPFESVQTANNNFLFSSKRTKRRLCEYCQAINDISCIKKVEFYVEN